MLLPNEAPICAIATPAGRGAIGIVRISGRELADLDLQLTGRTLADRIATYGPFLDDDGSAIDHGLAIRFAGPRSYTGEDVLELQGHGGPVVQQLLLQRVLRAGAALGLRPARPGEFTERAYLNDKLDLAQAEAVADLIDASTVQAARSAVRSLTGEFSLRIRALADQLLELRLLVEATLDFPEEEIEFIERADGLGRLRAIEAAVAEVLATARQGALLTEGMAVVLVGAPNVGKSSLLNALAGAEIAIVTPVAGTTRDRISQVVAIDGVPLNLIDTAGLHQSDDMVERIGIARTWEAIERADVIVHLLAADAEVRDEGLFRLIDQRAPAAAGRLTVINKIDLVGTGASVSGDGREVRVSALTGAGVDLLRTTLLRLAGHQPGAEGVFAARERHLQALRETLAHLSESQRYAAAGDRALELFAEELRLAHRALGLITGEVSADALLGVIFSRFCIGK